jgi:hypothetical protein
LWAKSGPPDWEFLNKLVGGYIESVKVQYEGRIRQAYVNTSAFINFGIDIVGPLVVWVPDKKVAKRAVV